ncbi:MAG: DNA mismatch repair endonuclease MutL [Lachnospiraceae bacterium]|nr:DNA mismatch repair endonuclease MutL [Lachnospiraceae bacterium]
MPDIHLLNQETIDKIAAGEIIERPSSVVKELVENAIDAKATAITVEIKDGGTSLIRITDNGCGIKSDQVSLAFLPHATSKINNANDLLSVKSLGFRGEALSSVCAVSQVELITKTGDEMLGTRFLIEGSKEISKDEIGAPNGSTFLIRNLFYNTPARGKFLKSNTTEGSYVNALMEHLAMSHPEISFKFISNGQTKLQTSGNSKSKDIIYQVYGRDITSHVLEIDDSCELFKVRGFIGKPEVSRGNRSYENYYINNRYSKSNIITRAIEEAYKNFMMQHQYPFCVLYFDFCDNLVDVNVHPTKMEVRFTEGEEIYDKIYNIIRRKLINREYIVDASVDKEDTKTKTENRFVSVEKAPEPFETKRLEKLREQVRLDSPYEKKYDYVPQRNTVRENTQFFDDNSTFHKSVDIEKPKKEEYIEPARNIEPTEQKTTYVQESFLSEEARKKHRVIGQVFKTYWLVEFDNKLYIIDQHAAHEKVLYEKNVKLFKEKTFTSQIVSPPYVVTLNAEEQSVLTENIDELEKLGFTIEHFGGMEYSVSSVPDNLYSLDVKQILVDFLDESAANAGTKTPDIIYDRLATMSCKAAIKGGDGISFAEAEKLIDSLLALENPYFCPHGRPTIISMTKYELEKKFKRII